MSDGQKKKNIEMFGSFTKPFSYIITSAKKITFSLAFVCQPDYTITSRPFSQD